MLLPILLLTAMAQQDVYVPPVPIGIRREGVVRQAKTPIPFPAVDGKWIRLRSTHFDFVSNAPESRTRTIAEELETLTAALTKTSSRFRRSPVPTRIFVFERRKESQPYFDLLVGREKTPVTGLFIRHNGGGTMIIDAERRWKGDRTPLHELVHDLLRQQSEVVPPLWVEEGLAEYFSNSTVTKTGIRVGTKIDEHVRLMRGRTVIPLDELLNMRGDNVAATSPHFYAESWAAVHYLMQLDRDGFYDFLRDMELGSSLEEALAKHFQKTVRDLDFAIRHADEGTVVRIDLPLVDVEAPAIEMSRSDLLYELGRFLGHIEGAEPERDRHYQAALQIDPKHARSLAATGNFEAAAAADPRDPEILLDYAEVLMTTAVGDFAQVFEPEGADVPRFRKAREAAERALALGGDEGRARGLAGTTYVVEETYAPGIPHLERAVELLPMRTDFALHLYALYLKSGEREKAKALYARTFDKARDKQASFAAKNILLRVETERANVLAHTGKYDQAAVIVRELAAQTPDAASRRELERQAADLENIGVVNQHIARYNEAVTLSNAGKYRDAVKLLDDLLKVATDGFVIRDATKLREELKKRR